MGAVLVLGNLLNQDLGESRWRGRSQHSPVRGGVTGCRSRLERSSARRSLGRVLCNPLLPGGAAHTRPREGMDLKSQGPRAAAAAHRACGFQQTPSRLQQAEAQECRAQHVSATVLTMLLRVPITTEMLPLSS